MTTLTQEQIKARIKALIRYQFDLVRIGEDSAAADREMDRVTAALSKLNSMLSTP